MHTTINGIRLEYEVLGKGDPILLVHGWNGRKESLKPLGEMLSKSFKVYLLDLPGFGTSMTPPKNWSGEDYVETVEEFIKHHKLFCLNYIGHSFGGGIGIKIAHDNPAMFKNLILISAAYHRDPRVSATSSVANKIPFYSSVKDRLIMPRRAYYKIFHPRSDALKKPELEKIYRKVIKEDLRPIIPKISTRTLVLWGGKDLSTPVGDAFYLRDNLQDVEIKIFKEDSHNLPIASPEMLAPVIEKFILDQ